MALQLMGVQLIDASRQLKQKVLDARLSEDSIELDPFAHAFFALMTNPTEHGMVPRLAKMIRREDEPTRDGEGVNVPKFILDNFMLMSQNRDLDGRKVCAV